MLIVAMVTEVIDAEVGNPSCVLSGYLLDLRELIALRPAKTIMISNHIPIGSSDYLLICMLMVAMVTEVL